MKPTERTDLQNRVTAAILMADIDITSGTRPQATDDQYRAIADRIIDKVVGPERLAAATLRCPGRFLLLDGRPGATGGVGVLSGDGSPDPVMEAWREMAALFEEICVQGIEKREVIDVYRSFRGFPAIDWTGIP